VQRLYEALIVSVIAKRAAGAVDPTAERGFRDYAAIPDRLYQIIFADDPITIAYQVDNDVEYLGLDMHGHPAPEQFMPARINFELSKTIFHYFLD